MDNAALSPSPEHETSDNSPKKQSMELPTQSQGNRSNARRPRKGAVRWLFALGVVGLMGTAAYTWPKFGFLGGAQAKENWITEPVVKGRLIVSVKEDGEVESASNLELKCEVAGGSTILWLIEDGKRVEEGEVILRLDESQIDEQLNAQKILYQKALATKIQAEQDYEAAKIAVEEYDKGTYVMEQQTAEANVKIAMENLRGAENLYNHTQKMFKKGFVTQQQLESDEFGVQRSKLELQSAQTALKVLQDFTRLKMLTQLKSARDAAEARMRSEQAACDLEKSKLEQLETQLEKCTITAPQPGMVIYAEIPQRGEDPVVSEGLAVHENQTLIQLPDLSQMQVVVPVHETKVNQIRKGMPARIVIQDRQYTGRVVSIASQPSEGSWWSSSEVKQYATTVAIEGEIDNLKPGMTAQVEIFAADLRDVLKVKVSAVVEQRGKFFVWVATPEGPERRPVLLGRTNDKYVAIKDGVVEGEQVLLNPRAVLDEARQGENEEADSTDEIPGEIPQGQSPGDTQKTSPQGKPNAPVTNDGNDKKRSSFSFSQFDKNGDGKVTKSEAPDRMKQNFDKADSNKDGTVDAAEWAAVMKSIEDARARQTADDGQQSQSQPAAGD